MRVLLVSPSSVPGGAERALTSLAAQLPALGAEVRAVLLQSGPLEDWLASAGCPVEVIEAGRTRQFHRTLRTIWRLARLARNADVVISNQSKGHVYGGLAAWFAGRPAVWWQQGTPQRSRIELTAAQVPVAAIVASSADSVSAQAKITPRRRIELVHLGIDLQSVRACKGTGTALRAAYGWGDAPLVGIVGRLQEWKGQNVFLRSASRVAVAVPEAQFVVVGGAVLGWEGDYPAQLLELATELGIADRVHFVGHQSDVYPWFDALDVVVHASFGEPFGLVLVEAMALGRPLIATAVGGPTEIVEEGMSGLLVPPGDDGAMASAIVRVLTDTELRSTLETGAWERAEHFDERRTAERFAGLLHELAGSEPLPGNDSKAPLVERTVPGLHEHVFRNVINTFPRLGRAIDLGAGSGAFAERMQRAGFDATACDRNSEGFVGSVPFHAVELDGASWADGLGTDQWSLVTAIEVIEHLEAPIGFLRNIARLLAPGGIAVVTTPNVDSLPARVKFLLKDRIRMLDEYGDPTHISPIFWDLLTRKYLPMAGLRLVQSSTYPTDTFVSGRPVYQRLLRAMGPLSRTRPRLAGDNHVLVLARIDDDG